MTTLELLSGLLIKPAALSLTALGMTALLRRRQASARHAVWTAAIAAMLALPVLAAILPDLRIPTLDAGAQRVSAATHVASPTRQVRPRLSESSPAQAVDRSETPRETSAEGVVFVACVSVWALVASLLLARRINAEVGVYRLAREARPASLRLRRVSGRLVHARQAERADIRVSALVGSPAVVGLVHAIVLLPEDAESWPDADLAAVLTHELGHVERRDCLTNFCADVAAILYWCNPLVGFSARRLRLEGERACDERVVNEGTDSRAYAELLLRVARADRLGSSLTRAATAMSRARELESRLMTLVDRPETYPAISRMAATLLVSTGVSITLPAAALTVRAADAPIATAAALISQVLPPEPDRLDDSLASPRSERLPFRIDESTLDRRVTEAFSGPDSVFARRLAVGLHHEPANEADLVRDRIRWVFGQAEGGRLIGPLLESLDDRDWRVQAYAVWALAVAGDAQAVPRLIPLLRHSVWRVRAMAAFALRALGDPGAEGAMRAALVDPAWQVRVEAVEYVAAIGGDDARELIRARLDDRHIAVRRAAQSAIGVH